MGLYADHILPRVVEHTCGAPELEPLRAEACAGLRGLVLEVGFGSGLNLPHLPAGVDRVLAVEPADLSWTRSQPRRTAARARGVVVERSGLDGQRLALPDQAADSALATFTLCTIPDVRAALAEVRRVLRPGGTLAYLEHGLAPDDDPDVQRWQHRLEPVQKRLGGGCHLTRRADDLVSAAGFVPGQVRRFYLPGSPRFAAALVLGTASAP